MTLRVPSYRLHKPSGRAIVKHQGRVFYIGKYGTKASKAEYARLLALWSADESAIASAATRDDFTIVELLAAFRQHALEHYRRNGQPTRSIDNIMDAIRPVRLLSVRQASTSLANESNADLAASTGPTRATRPLAASKPSIETCPFAPSPTLEVAPMPCGHEAWRPTLETAPMPCGHEAWRPTLEAAPMPLRP
jgi:hypothetical protein